MMHYQVIVNGAKWVLTLILTDRDYSNVNFGRIFNSKFCPDWVIEH